MVHVCRVCFVFTFLISLRFTLAAERKTSDGHAPVEGVGSAGARRGGSGGEGGGSAGVRRGGSGVGSGRSSREKATYFRQLSGTTRSVYDRFPKDFVVDDEGE